MAKFCTNCGNPLREGIAFCENCGTAVSTANADDVSKTVGEVKEAASEKLEKTVGAARETVEAAKETVVEKAEEAASEAPQPTDILAEMSDKAAQALRDAPTGVPSYAPQAQQTFAQQAPFGAAQAQAQPDPSFAPPQQTPPQAPAYQAPYYGVPVMPAKKKTSAGVIVLIALLAVALIVAAAFLVPKFLQKGTESGKTFDEANVGYPTMEDFDWAYELEDDALPKDAKTLSDLDALTGTWKANLSYFDENDEYMGIEELARFSIRRDGRSFRVTFEPYRYRLSDDGDWKDESDDETLVFDCEVDEDGCICGDSDGWGDLELYDFYVRDGKQYGFGDILFYDGMTAYIWLVRP